MYTKDVEKHFQYRSRAADLLQISRAAVYQWGPIVPELSAYRLQDLTQSKLRVIPRLYLRKKHMPGRPKKTTT